MDRYALASFQSHHGLRGNSDHGGGFLEIQTGEEAQLDGAGFARIEDGESGERVVALVETSDLR